MYVIPHTSYVCHMGGVYTVSNVFRISNAIGGLNSAACHTISFTRVRLFFTTPGAFFEQVCW